MYVHVSQGRPWKSLLSPLIFTFKKVNWIYCEHFETFSRYTTLVCFGLEMSSNIITCCYFQNLHKHCYWSTAIRLQFHHIRHSSPINEGVFPLEAFHAFGLYHYLHKHCYWSTGIRQQFHHIRYSSPIDESVFSFEAFHAIGLYYYCIKRDDKQICKATHCSCQGCIQILSFLN